MDGISLNYYTTKLLGTSLPYFLEPVAAAGFGLLGSYVVSLVGAELGPTTAITIALFTLTFSHTVISRTSSVLFGHASGYIVAKLMNFPLNWQGALLYSASCSVLFLAVVQKKRGRVHQKLIA